MGMPRDRSVTTAADNEPDRFQSPSSKRLPFILAFAVIAAIGAAFYSWKMTSGTGEEHFNKGKIALASHDEATAEREWLAGAKEQPDYVLNFVELGSLYLGQKRFPEALTAYRTASKLVPDNGQILYRLSFAELVQGNFPQAESAGRRAAELLPKDPEVQGALGMMEAKLDQGAEAYRAFKRAHALAPDNRAFLLDMASRGLFEPDAQACEDEVAAYLVKNPADAEALYYMGAFEHRKPATPERLKTAIGYAEQADAGQPGDQRIQKLLAELYLAASRPADALRMYQKALKKSPKSAELLHGAMLCYVHLGQPDKATALEHLIPPDPRQHGLNGTATAGGPN